MMLPEDEGKSFDKIRYFITNTMKKIYAASFLNIVKASYDKPIAGILLKSKD